MTSCHRPRISLESKAFGDAGLKIGMKNIPQQKAPVAESGPLTPFFSRLPITTSWPEDGGLLSPYP